MICMVKGGETNTFWIELVQSFSTLVTYNILAHPINNAFYVLIYQKKYQEIA